jgi:hypothetical protein
MERKQNLRDSQIRAAEERLAKRKAKAKARERASSSSASAPVPLDAPEENEPNTQEQKKEREEVEAPSEHFPGGLDKVLTFVAPTKNVPEVQTELSVHEETQDQAVRSSVVAMALLMLASKGIERIYLGVMDGIHRSFEGPVNWEELGPEFLAEQMKARVLENARAWTYYVSDGEVETEVQLDLEEFCMTNFNEEALRLGAKLGMTVEDQLKWILRAVLLAGYEAVPDKPEDPRRDAPEYWTKAAEWEIRRNAKVILEAEQNEKDAGEFKFTNVVDRGEYDEGSLSKDKAEEEKEEEEEDDIYSPDANEGELIPLPEGISADTVSKEEIPGPMTPPVALEPKVPLEKVPEPKAMPGSSERGAKGSSSARAPWHEPPPVRGKWANQRGTRGKNRGRKRRVGGTPEGPTYWAVPSAAEQTSTE